MVTAPMLVQSVPVNLPAVDSTPTEIEPDDSTIIISVDARGLYFIERGGEQPRAMALADVQDYARKITAQVPATKLLIRGDENVPYGKVVVLMGSLQSIGVNNIGLITEAPDPEARAADSADSVMSWRNPNSYGFAAFVAIVIHLAVAGLFFN